jgi:hypothetical protein
MPYSHLHLLLSLASKSLFANQEADKIIFQLRITIKFKFDGLFFKLIETIKAEKGSSRPQPTTPPHATLA